MATRKLLAATLLVTGCSVINPLNGQGVLILRPELTSARYGTQAQVDLYTKASVNHLILKLYTFDGAEHDLNVQKSIPNANLDNAVSFLHLKSGRTYRVKAFAYASADESQLISTTASDSYTDFIVETDDAPTIGALKVKLINSEFNGQGTGSIGFVPAQYTYPGNEGLDLEVPPVLPYFITTFAGSGTEGYAGDEAAATTAQFKWTKGIGKDGAGNFYVADAGNNRLRKITTDGKIHTLAGTGASGYSGDEGPATSAMLSILNGDIAVDTAGNVYVADAGNNRIRKITTDGVIRTIAGNGVGSFSGDGGPAIAAQVKSPQGIAVDAAGNVYVADAGNNRIRQISTDGNISTVAGNGAAPNTSDGDGDGKWTYDVPDGLATATPISCDYQIAVDGLGNIFVPDGYNFFVRKVGTDGNIHTIAGDGGYDSYGDGGPATAAALARPTGIAVDNVGNVYVGDESNAKIRKIAPDGIITTIAGNGASYTWAGDGGLATDAQLDPLKLFYDNTNGSIYVADFKNNRIRKLYH